MNVTDRRRGALWGLAVGDALGAPVEFARPGTFEPVTHYRAGGPFGLAAGEWTDDTSMALALADSLSRGFDPKDQLDRYTDWFRRGAFSCTGRCFDCGTATRAALERYAATGDPLAGNPDPRVSGNGSLMRLAPVPIRYHDLWPQDAGRYLNLAADSSRTTHSSPACLSACRLLAAMLAALIRGEPRSVVLDAGWEGLGLVAGHTQLEADTATVAAGSYRRLDPPDIRGRGYVVSCLEAALWAFYRGDGFRSVVLAAVNLGDDADTTGAVAGMLAGAHWGESGIPAEFRSGLARPDLIETALVGLGAGRPVGGAA